MEAYWSAGHEVPVMSLPIATNLITTPAEARDLATSARLLAETFKARSSRPDAGKHDGRLAMIIGDASAALSDHARNLEYRAELEAAEFAAKLPDSMGDEQ